MNARLLPAAAAVLASVPVVASAQTDEIPAATVDIEFVTPDNIPVSTTFVLGTATGTPISTDPGSRTSIGEVGTQGDLRVGNVYAVVDPPAGCTVTGGVLTATAQALASPFNLLGPQTEVVELFPAGACGINFPTDPPGNLAPCSGNQIALGLAPDTETQFDLSTVAALGIDVGPVDGELEFQPTGPGCEAIEPARAYFSFTLLAGSGMLPVELAAFDARASADADRITWTAAEEDGVAFYDVERSTNAMDFERVATVDALGTTEGPREYSTRLSAPASAAATRYYRLRSVDFDGGEQVSRVVSVSGLTADTPAILSGNYAAVGVGARVASLPSGVQRLEVYDMTGRQLADYPAELGLEIGAELPVGHYVLAARAPSGVTSERFTIR